MRKHVLLALASVLIAAFCCQSVPAQLPGGLKIPKLSKPKPTPTPAETTAQPAPSSETRTAAQPSSSAAPPQATAGDTTLVKTRIGFWPETLTSYKGEYNNVWSWIPTVTFVPQGPGLPSGGQYYVEVTQPNGAPWVKLKCVGNADGTGYDCGNSNDLEKEGTLATGVFPFAIKMRNPLEGTDKTLFTGRAKVEKVLSSGNIPPTSKQFVYYTNQDWNLPIGYVFIGNNDNLYVRFWIRGETPGVEAHLFYRGAEVGRFESNGYQYGASRCSPDIEYRPTRDAGAGAPQGAKWARMDCPFQTITTKPNPNNSEWHVISANPGEYEVKVLRNKRLARVLKFSIGSDGQIVDNGIASGNGMAGDNFIFVPVLVVGDLDGVWDRNAWKTDAFYGHALKGFTWPPQ
ncbi:MAG: hypothetical protein QOD32_2115 [Pyrinomonadaceae bacterium]|jgi:hypothetical protein|nr:hypothetical protein [Pyrinomonadaceae bacterium]